MIKQGVCRPMTLHSTKECTFFLTNEGSYPDVFCDAGGYLIDANVFISFMSMETGKIYEMVRFINSHYNFKLYLFRQYLENGL